MLLKSNRHAQLGKQPIECSRLFCGLLKGLGPVLFVTFSRDLFKDIIKLVLVVLYAVHLVRKLYLVRFSLFGETTWEFNIE